MLLRYLSNNLCIVCSWSKTGQTVIDTILRIPLSGYCFIERPVRRNAISAKNMNGNFVSTSDLGSCLGKSKFNSFE